MDEWDLITTENSSKSDGSGYDLFAAVRRGDFLAVLQSPVARPLLEPFARVVGLNAQQHGSLALIEGIVPDLTSSSPTDVLCVAIAALNAFVQANWTGPELCQDLKLPVKLLRRATPDAFPPRKWQQDDDQIDIEFDAKLATASVDALTWAGEPAYHLCESPFLLLLSLRLLDRVCTSSSSARSASNTPIVSAPWWRLRAHAIHSRILDSPTSPSSGVMEELANVKQFLVEQGTRVTAAQDETHSKQYRWRHLLSRLLVDEALTLQRCGREREASERLLEAASSSSLHYEVTGAPGKRTKFQKEDKMILVLLARSAGDTNSDEASVQSTKDNVIEASQQQSEEYDAAPSDLQGLDRTGWKATVSTDGPENMPSEMLHNDDTLLERTRFTSTSIAARQDTVKNTESADLLSKEDVARPSVLHPLDSCILLGLCLNIHNTAPENGLTASEMSAFVQRVLAHARNWSVHTMALLLRSRLEANRTRTAQRSALQLQALLDQMPSSDSRIDERLDLVHELEMPPKWEMQAELARRYAALGVLRSALEIFERIEMWQEVVQCWGVLGRQDKGIEVIRDLLEGHKAEAEHVLSEKKKDRSLHVRQELNVARQAKLLCLLGDLEANKAQEHYQKAWTVSGRRSARAARSLGAVAFAQGDWIKATLWLRRALKIQPSYARSWFMLGCVYMRREDSHYLDAARCFRRCVSLDDEDAESWSNLASCYLRLAWQSEDVLREARLADEASGETDQRAVLAGMDFDGDAESDGESLHSRDSGVAVDSGTDHDDEEDEEDGPETDTEDVLRDRRQRRAVGTHRSEIGHDSRVKGIGSGQGAFDVKLLAHRALTKALRFAHDDWRVWYNFMTVSVNCGLMNDAVRALVRVVEIRGSARAAALEDKVSGSSSDNSGVEDAVDMSALNRIVDAVTRAPSSEHDAIVGLDEDSTSAPSAEQHVQHNPHEGHGLWPAVRSLFDDVLLPRISSSASVWRAYARLLFWRGLFRGALEAHLAAWRASYGAETSGVETNKAHFVQAIDALQELCEVLENFGPREVALDAQGNELDVDAVRSTATTALTHEAAMDNWRFRARSLVRSFMGRTRDAFDGEEEWQRLIDLRDSLAPNAA